jgi:hypothetical protein
MNTVLLDDLSDQGEASWWARALRGIGKPGPRTSSALTTLRDDTGAERVAARLGAILDDNWTLICGHCNGGGRLEHILVGPRGVLALASSTLNGRMHCDGQRWRRDKFDLYNSLVTRDVPIPADPASVMLRAAGRLEHALLDHTSIRHVATGLVFTHPAATLGHILHGRLDLVALLSDLKSAALLEAMSGHPDHRTIDGVVDVIRDEHARHMRYAAQKKGKRQPLFLEQ